MNLNQPTWAAPMQSEREFLIEAPLLKALDAQLKACKSQKEWAIVRARQALYLARTHRISEAAEVPAELRKLFRGFEDPEVFIWIWLAEAVVAFYQDGTSVAFSKIIRAQKVSLLIGRTDLTEYLAAWAAHLSFTINDSKNMIKWLLISRCASATIPDAACRASLTTAVAWQTGGDASVANIWFAKARDIARVIGDRASIMASIANRATIALNEIWISAFVGPSTSLRLEDCESELRGALAYEQVTGSESLPAQAVIMRARLFYLRGDLNGALRELDGVDNEDLLIEYSVFRSTNIFREFLRLSADSLYPVVMKSIEEYEDEFSDLDCDDQSVSWALLDRISGILSLGEVDRQYFRRRSNECFEQYIGMRNDLRRSLSEEVKLGDPRLSFDQEGLGSQ